MTYTNEIGKTFQVHPRGNHAPRQGAAECAAVGMTRKLSLRRFEEIDGLHSQLVRMGDFMSCADPRGFVSLSNRLLDACLGAGMPHDEPNHETWAACEIARAMVSA